jgi:uncharacterized low-complexity protein
MAARTKAGTVWAVSPGVEINSSRPSTSIKANNSNHHSRNNIQTKVVDVQVEEATVIGARKAKLPQGKVGTGNCSSLKAQTNFKLGSHKKVSYGYGKKKNYIPQ